MTNTATIRLKLTTLPKNERMNTQWWWALFPKVDSGWIKYYAQLLVNLFSYTTLGCGSCRNPHLRCQLIGSYLLQGWHPVMVSWQNSMKFIFLGKSQWFCGVFVVGYSTALSQTKLRTFLWCRGTTKRRACHQVEAMLVLVLVFTCHLWKMSVMGCDPHDPHESRTRKEKATRPSQALKSWISCEVPQLVISGSRVKTTTI